MSEIPEAKTGSIEPVKVEDNKFTEAQLKQVETLSGLGLTRLQIGAVLGVSDRSIRSWAAASPAFSDALDRGKSIALSNVAKKAYELAIKGNVNMIKYWLSTQAKWKETTVIEHTGEGGGPVEATYVPPEERLKRLEILREQCSYIEPEPQESEK
jgi:hypothetical protein